MTHTKAFIPEFGSNEWMVLQKAVTPAESGVHHRLNHLIQLDSGFHRNGGT